MLFLTNISYSFWMYSSDELKCLTLSVVYNDWYLNDLAVH